MFKSGLFFVVFFYVGFSFAQKEVTIQFDHLFEGQVTELNDTLFSSLGNYPFVISDYNYYISRVELIHDGGQVLKLDSNKVFLVKMDFPSISLGLLNVNQIEQIHFTVGVPEYLNHLDISMYENGHPLSFQHPSMHWGWSAGYMHHIVSAMVDTDNNETFEAYFELHNLGDLNTKEVTITTTATEYPNNELRIHIETNVDRWLTALNVSTIGIEHGSSGYNAQIMQNVIDYSVFTSPATASISDEIAKENFIWTNQEGENILRWKNISVDKIEVIDLEGKVVSMSNQLIDQEYKLKEEKGVYLIRAFSKRKVVFTSSRII